jgi:hypothetical protein
MVYITMGMSINKILISCLAAAVREKNVRSMEIVATTFRPMSAVDHKRPT